MPRSIDRHAIWKAEVDAMRERGLVETEEFLQLVDRIARTRPATLPECLAQAELLRELLHPDMMAPEETELHLINNLVTGLRHLTVGEYASPAAI
ncbi:MAG: hypothetical protein U1E45_14830 [Geminicoccaceae bacterium]